MYGMVDKPVDIYMVCVESNVLDRFGMNLQCVNAEKPVLTYLPNLRISELKQRNHRIRRLIFSEEQATADKLPVHMILGAVDTEKMFFMTSSKNEFSQMCSQEVRGLTGVENVHVSFHEDCIDQPQRLEDGTYFTRLPWKPKHTCLPSKKELTVRRLRSGPRKLQRMQRLEEYHTVMEQQLDEGILEVVLKISTGEVIHYTPLNQQSETRQSLQRWG